MESAPVLALRYHLNIKTVLKWKKALRVHDNPPPPIKIRSSLTQTEQHIVCEFRRVTKLPLDDVFVALRDSIPALSRAYVYRCLKRSGLNVLPTPQIEEQALKSFKEYPIGFVHIDITEIRTKQGKCYLFVAIDRATKPSTQKFMRTKQWRMLPCF